MSQIIVRNDHKKLVGKISLPASKSESNRALMIKALCDEGIFIHNLSDAADTQILNRCLRYIETCGVSGIPMIIDAKNAGTVYRFLTAYLAIRPGKWMLTGSERMQERPIKQLVQALYQINADISYLEKKGYPPLLISGNKLSGGKVELDSGISSQYITALLLIAPLLTNGLELKLIGKLISRPYVQMTIAIMKHFGVSVDYNNSIIKIHPQKYNPTEFTASPDWSAASYWYEMAVLSDEVDLMIADLNEDSLQGDSVLPEIYKAFGIQSVFTKEGLRLKKQSANLTYFEYDFVDCPDLAQTVIATCVGLGIEGSFKGLQSLRIKETDRIEKLSDEIAMFGFAIEEVNSNLWKLVKKSDRTAIPENQISKTYDDHRMAMCLAPLSLVTPKMTISDPMVVKKSYPTFWSDLEMLGFDLKKE